ncbi:hypothetical protein YC2023_024870 [Brassica napus]
MVESGMRRAAIRCGIEIAFLMDEKCHKTLWSRDNKERANEPGTSDGENVVELLFTFGFWSEKYTQRKQTSIHKLTKELSVEIQVSFFEEANNAHYNSVSIGYVDEVTSVFIGRSTVSRGSSSYGTEYCFISLPLAVNFKTRDWIRVIIGVEARKGMLEIMCDFTGTCAINYMYIQQQPQPQTTYNLSNASICAFVLTVCVSFNKAFYRILINGNTLSISK